MSGCRRILVRGRALFVVLDVLYRYRLRLLFFVVVVVVVSHIEHIGCQPEKITWHGGQSRSWSAEQGN